MIMFGWQAPALDAKMNQAVLELASAGKSELLSRVLAQGADVNTTGAYGETALHLAAWRGSLSMVKLLASKGADVDRADQLGRTPCLLAAANGKLDVVSWLKGKGAKLNTVDNMGFSMLMWAAAGNHVDIIKFLLRNGVNMNGKDKKGRTAFDVIRFNTDFIKTADLMRELGAQRGSHKRADGDLGEIMRKQRNGKLAAVKKKTGLGYGGGSLPLRNPKARDAYLLGTVLLLEGKRVEAGKALSQAEKLEKGGCAPCRFPLAEIYLETGELEKARSTIEVLAKAGPDPRLNGLYFQLGKALLTAGDDESATPHLYRAAKADPVVYNEANYHLGSLADDRDDLDEARTLLNAYISNDANGPFAQKARTRLEGLGPTTTSVRGTDGKRLDMADYQSKYLLIEFWASDDADRQKTLKNLKKLNGLDKLNLISVYVGGQRPDSGEGWPMFHDPNMRHFNKRYQLTEVPTLLLLNKYGQEDLRIRGEEVMHKSIIKRVKKAIKK
ncbi:MAG: ankyrin repeat domain-containing protein [Acidobacteriota bacterium]|nr:ankyrin repeat domain-containing protein [Acidobacteriota bacterium]